MNTTQFGSAHAEAAFLAEKLGRVGAYKVLRRIYGPSATALCFFLIVGHMPRR